MFVGIVYYICNSFNKLFLLGSLYRSIWEESESKCIQDSTKFLQEKELQEGLRYPQKDWTHLLLLEKELALVQ